MLMLLVAVVSALSATGSVAGKYPVICYWESWSVYRAAPYTGNVLTLPVDKCTHVIYTFLGLDESTNRVKYLDPFLDIDHRGIAKFVALKEVRRDLKVSFAIGGWNERSERYSRMASTYAGRRIFATSVAAVIQKFDFDGVDLDWEYPGAVGGNPYMDKLNFVLLLKAIRKAIGKDKLLTVAVPAIVNVDIGYNVPEISKIVDYIHVMTYDLHGPWEPTVDNHVLLHKRRSDPAILTLFNVAGALIAWEARGAPSSKLILGFAFYGRSFTLANSNKTYIGAPAQGPGRKGPISQTEGTLFYFEICELLRTNKDWTSAWDNEAKVPYAYGDDQWVGYDNEEGIKYKVELIKSAGYGGAMIWAVNNDDANALCNTKVKYPLLTAISAQLNGNESRERASQTSKTSSALTSTTLDGRTTPRDLAPSLNYNSTISEMESISTSTAALPTTSAALWPQRCEKHTLPHTASCRKFFVCDDAGRIRLTELNCPAGLVYNEDQLVCDWNFNTHPAPAGCPDFL
ncbi:endochitinase-like [Varroa jacobsoni]|uniref:endochitinase-like n=1 Tax=Varroa jacobsoni TaxID=62625 RepID=UPI000BF96E45|nr:endochitinase-like [Varroa jacobsoni]